MEGQETSLILGADAATVAGRVVPWTDVDLAEEVGRDLVWHIASGLDPATEPLRITHLGSQHDECAGKIRVLRGAARRAARAQTPHEPVEEFTGRLSGRVEDVIVLPHAIAVEPRSGPDVYIPWGLVRDVERDGYEFNLRCRAMESIVVGGFGSRSDEFAEVVTRARSDLECAIREAYAASGAEGCHTPDGWAVSGDGEGVAIAAAWSGMARSAEMQTLVKAADEMRVGLWIEGGAALEPFVLCRAGGRVALEAVDADDRATFVFETNDLDRLNGALLLTSFRREVLSSEPADLGRWAAAVRTQPEVRWLREALVARVVHSASWESAVLAALAG